MGNVQHYGHDDTVVQQEISFSEIKDPGVTGNFEIKVNGALVHSKKTQGPGHGFLHNCDASQQAAVLETCLNATGSYWHGGRASRCL
ncbi:yqeH [Symbiodinium sp. CCMP2592]|nr:yqeH [Symbiodinium sp. CCMP2592]